ncbi:MAG: tyrosine-protein phosphatase, partial [FCB group bacterium]|nr:tyrosine-protein phosphatase [FCB group bacterium]
MKKKTIVTLVVIGFVIFLLGMPVWHYQFGYNFRTVEKGVFYGSRQMSGRVLESTVHKYGIKTVISLRGENPGKPWYDEEVETCERLGVKHVSFGWSKSHLPDPESLASFVDLLESGERPFLAHCEGGTHRAGVASACYLLLHGSDPATARGQFGPGFNDAPIGKLVDLYEQSGMPFKKW